MKTLIITGGTGGLGTAVVARLQRDYECVLLRSRLTDEDAVRAELASHTPYGLVHMVGGFAPGRVSETSLDTLQRMMTLNLTTSFIAIRETLARMNRKEPGRIIAISSFASIEKPAAVAAYTVSKSALNTLIEVTAAELAGTPITANALLPGTLDTPASRESMPNAPRVPLEKMAETIAFLLSNAASNITGALLGISPSPPR